MKTDNEISSRLNAIRLLVKKNGDKKNALKIDNAIFELQKKFNLFP